MCNDANNICVCLVIKILESKEKRARQGAGESFCFCFGPPHTQSLAVKSLRNPASGCKVGSFLAWMSWVCVCVGAVGGGGARDGACERWGPASAFFCPKRKNETTDKYFLK